MLVVSNVSMQFGGRVLYKDVNLSFTQGNCYGVIGANGAGKSTFLKIISNELEPTSGSVTLTENERMSILKQNQNEYDDFTLVDTVIQGHSRLVEIMKEKDELYAKTDFSEEDGIKAAELESEFATLEGWEADSNARSLLSNLGINVLSAQSIVFNCASVSAGAAIINKINNIDMINIEVPAKVDSFFNILIPLEAR